MELQKSGKKSLIHSREYIEQQTTDAINRGEFGLYQLAIMHDWLRTLTLMATILVPLFFILDMVIMPVALLPKFGVYRLVSTILSIGILFVVYNTKPGKLSYVHGYLLSLQIGAVISLMTVDLGGFDSSYYAGLNLVVMGVNLLMPWRALHTAANSLVIFIMYLSFNFVSDRAFDLQGFFNNIFFMGSTIVLSIAINYVRYKLIKKEFKLLVDLGKTRDALLSEKLVVEDRTKSLKSLLDVSGQGFLSFNQNFEISPEYSKECEKILGKDLEKQKIEDLLFTNESKKEEFKGGLKLYFANRSKPEVIFDLLEHVIEVNDRILQVEYKAVNPKRVMLVLTDITEQRRLQEEARRDNEKWNRLLKVIANRQPFALFEREARALFAELAKPLGGYKAIVQDIHTFKANAGFLGFANTQMVAHEFEDFLNDRITLGEDIVPGPLIDKLSSVYQTELSTITTALGKEWHLNPDLVEISLQDLITIENYIINNCPDKAIVEMLEGMRLKPVEELLNRFSMLAADLAGRLGKRIEPLEIVGGGVKVALGEFDELIGSFIHLVRNMVDHGIEQPSERVALAKPSAGRISIHVEETEHDIVFAFSDDGRGLQLDMIEAQAKKMGLIKNGQQLSPADLVSMIFREAFSTTIAGNEISGRGVGLSAVRSAVNKMGGHIKVKTAKNQGTTFIITVAKKPQKVLEVA